MGSFGQRLKQERERLGLTQEHVAKAIKRSQRAVSLLERGDRLSPNSKTLSALAALFDVDPEWLLTGRGDRRPVTSLSPQENELLLLFRALSSPGKSYLMQRLQDLHRGEHGNVPSSKASQSDDNKTSDPERRDIN